MLKRDSKSSELRGYITVYQEVLNTCLSLIVAVMLSGGSEVVVLKVELDCCTASEVLGIHLRV